MTYVVSVSVITDILVKADDDYEAVEKARALVDTGKVELDYMSTLDNTRYEVAGAFDEEIVGD